ncbi:MAG TPA: penicillin-binding transpeptidase domain-containing protein [Armatimonadota bacterium]|nr:penicillin-binding transpeptidase domain-containing protein [Armatimonadota bacterium]
MREWSAGIRRIALVAMAGFALQCAYLSYWQVFRAPSLRADEHNTRAQERLKRIEPGKLLDRHGDVMLDARRTTRGWERVYPQGRDACHVTGYNSRSGVQSALRDAFLGIGSYEKPWHEFIEGLDRGNDVRLTIDLRAQQLATRLLRGQRGAVVALDARDGAVLTMVSAPGYDPETLLDNDWEYNLFREDPTAPELNRALQGLYPPGSVMKILTAAAALDLGRVTPDTKLTCEGSCEVDGEVITCPRRHGSITITQALELSCNVGFTKIGQMIGADDFRGYVKRFHLLDQANLPLPSAAGRMGELTGPRGKVMLAETAFGQGQTLVTPMAIARLTLAIASGGQVRQPYVVAAVLDAGGSTVNSRQALDLGRAVSAQTAAEVAGMMVGVVEEGTAQDAALRSVEVAGKTGSAENPHGEPHAWFTAFAPADSPRVVVTVIVENGGAGSEAAVPIARRVMLQLLSED